MEKYLKKITVSYFDKQISDTKPIMDKKHLHFDLAWLLLTGAIFADGQHIAIRQLKSGFLLKVVK